MQSLLPIRVKVRELALDSDQTARVTLVSEFVEGNRHCFTVYVPREKLAGFSFDQEFELRQVEAGAAA